MWSRSPLISVKGQSYNRGAGGISWGLSTEVAQGRTKDLHKCGIPRTLQASLRGKVQGSLQCLQQLCKRVGSPDLCTSLSPERYSDPFAVFIDCVYSSYIFLIISPSLAQLLAFSTLRKSEPTEICQNCITFIDLNLPRFYESCAFKKS